MKLRYFTGAILMTSTLSFNAMALPIELPDKVPSATPYQCMDYADYYEGNYDNTWDNLASDWRWISDQYGIWEGEMCYNHLTEFFQTHRRPTVSSSDRRIKCRQRGKRDGYDTFKNSLQAFCDEYRECSDDGLATGDALGRGICSEAFAYNSHLYPSSSMPNWLCDWYLVNDCSTAAWQYVWENCWDDAMNVFEHSGVKNRIDSGCRAL